MKRYWKELLILLIQLMAFYLLPLFSSYEILMIFIAILITFILSIFMGNISKEKTKYFYPLTVSILFIPSIYIYYNETALIYTLIYFIISLVGLLIGMFMYNKKEK